MRHLQQFIIILILSVSAVIGIGSNTAAASESDDYKNIFISASRNSFKEQIQHFSMDVKMSLTLKDQAVDIAAQSDFDIQQKPLVGKGIVKLIFNTPSMTQEQRLPLYIEQTTGQIVLYINANGKWLKKTVPVPEPVPNDNDSLVNFCRSIKSVSLINEDKDTFIFEVTQNQKDNQELIELSSNYAQLKPVTDLLVEDFKYRVTVDKKKNSITKMSFDMSDLVAKVGPAIGEVLKLPDMQKQEIERLFQNITFNGDIRFSKSDNTMPIIIPDEARNAIEQSDTIGYVDIKRIVAESPVIKSQLGQITIKAKELSQQLTEEKETLTDEEFEQRKGELNQELIEYKKEVRTQVNKIIWQAISKVKNEKNLAKILTKKPENTFVNSVDVTTDVIEKIESNAAQ